MIKEILEHDKFKEFHTPKGSFRTILLWDALIPKNRGLTGSWFSREATFAENPRLQLWLCKLCDFDCANPTDPSNHIVANHHQVALWKLHRAEKLLKILTLKRAIMIDVVASTETFSCTAKPKHEVPFNRFRTNSRMLQIGTTVPNSSRWTRRCRRRSRWRATRAAARPSTLLPALAIRTLGEDQVQGADTVPREESDCWPVERETQIVNFILLYRQRRLLPQKSWCFAVWWNWD